MKVYCEECEGAGWKVIEDADPSAEEILNECQACKGCGFTERNDLEELVQIGTKYLISRKEWNAWILEQGDQQRFN